MNGSEGGGEFGWGLGLESVQFGDVSGANRDVSGSESSDPMSLDLRANHGGGGRGGANGGGARKRRDLDDESTKGVRYVFEVHQLFFISFLGFTKSMDKSRID